MKYEVRIMAPVARKAAIKEKVDTTKVKRDFFAFRNRKSELPVIQVPIDLPIYRMQNFRTFTDQREYIQTEGKKPNFFSAGQEQETVQQAQHKLLFKLASKGKADSVVPVKDVIEKDGQREPLLISADGIVVNGNRRLAALRELYEEEKAKNPRFSHIDVMVLPADATAVEILDVEANLQAMPETKLDYDWIGEAQLIKSLVELGRDYDQVATQLHRKEKEIKYALLQLAEADLYLKTINKEGAYALIREDAEQLFSDLPKAIEGKSEREKRASRVIAYTLFQNKDKLPGRLYDFNAAFGKHSSEVLARVGADLGLPSEDAPAEDEDQEDFDIDIDGEDGGPTDSYDNVLSALQSKDNEEAVDALIEAAQTEIELARGKKSGNAALKIITQAHSKLASADLTKAAPATFTGIGKQLEAIKALITNMEATLQKRQKK